MSQDSKYIIQYEGPFSDSEWNGQLKELNAIPNAFEFKEFGYETIIGEVKWSADEEIIKIAKKSSPLQILKRTESYWKDIYNFGEEKKQP